jgi:hypothetical protein
MKEVACKDCDNFYESGCKIGDLSILGYCNKWKYKEKDKKQENIYDFWIVKEYEETNCNKCECSKVSSGSKFEEFNGIHTCKHPLLQQLQLLKENKEFICPNKPEWLEREKTRIRAMVSLIEPKTYDKLKEEFYEKVKKLQEECKHIKSDWMREEFAIGHSTGHEVRICRNCNKVIEKR